MDIKDEGNKIFLKLGIHLQDNNILSDSKIKEIASFNLCSVKEIYGETSVLTIK